ncbi:hypothetical protein TNCV_3936351 [Trichonephila clavipes]|nr:hypothetical protein TNCV_3936351 [Trichonephila clavipes]
MRALLVELESRMVVGGPVAWGPRIIDMAYTAVGYAPGVKWLVYMSANLEEFEKALLDTDTNGDDTLTITPCCGFVGRAIVRTETLRYPGRPPDTSVVVVRTQFDTELVSKDYTSLVRAVPRCSRLAPLHLNLPVYKRERYRAILQFVQPASFKPLSNSDIRSRCARILRGGIVTADLAALDRQKGLFVYSCVLVILDGKRPGQDRLLGQDIVTSDEVPQHQRNDDRSPPVSRKLPLVPGTIDDVQKSPPFTQAKMVNHLTVNTIGTRRFI